MFNDNKDAHAEVMHYYMSLRELSEQKETTCLEPRVGLGGHVQIHGVQGLPSQALPVRLRHTQASRRVGAAKLLPLQVLVHRRAQRHLTDVNFIVWEQTFFYKLKLVTFPKQF